VAQVQLESVTKRFGKVVAVDELSMTIEEGEFLVLLGPSGCGKTTLLRMIAGLEDVSDGAIYIDDVFVNDLAPKDRDIAMVFQTYALYPHLTVRKNIAFPLQQQHVSKASRDELVRSTAETLGLGDLLDRKPGQLSGGQRQRVALARAIVRNPKVFLMDEPLSNLDALLRIQTRADIVSIQSRLAVTTVYVTHDQVEAMTMGHRIAVLSEGTLQQVGPPTELYEEPINTFVAGFLGNPGMNLVKGDVRGGKLSIAGREVRSSSLPDGGITVGFRPERVSLSSAGIPATADFVEMLGADAHVLCSLPTGERVIVRQSIADGRPAAGSPVHLAVEDSPTSLHVFDTETGLRVRSLS
jgi:multiple sugar transport system ATP-binding protein